MILATASAIRGHSSPIPDGLVLVVAALLYAGVGYWAGGWYMSAAAFVLVFAWQFTFRGSKQAKIELQCMDTINAPHPRLRDVLAAHYYTGWLTCLGLYLFNYATKWGQKLGWEQKFVIEGRVKANAQGRAIEIQPFWDCRRPTEALTGLTGDIMMSVILCTLARVI